MDDDDDGDGVDDLDDIDPLDPDIDGDGINDGLDPDPEFSNNMCTGDVAVFSGTVVDTVVCGAGTSITVSPSTVVSGPNGKLILISPSVKIEPDFEAHRFEIISEDPCATCD